MHNKLVSDEKEIIDKFRTLSSRTALANLFEIEDKNLIFILYREKVDKYYHKFSVEKKNGKLREISAPMGSLKIIQSKLKFILDLIYEPRECVQGFVKDRDIISNASKHFGKRYIINLDIKDFFSTIHFGRVRGLFLNKPFSFNNEVSTVLAQICCLDNQLPQGAPTSPIIANLICGRLDSSFIRLSKKYNFYYTRYADDITLSSNQKFRKDIIKFKKKNFMDIKVSSKIKEIFIANDFKINKEKVHFSTSKYRQEITGIVINEKLNVHYQYIKEIRAILHSWKTKGLDATQEKYFELRKGRYSSNEDRLPDFTKVMLGKINFLRMVRGYHDKIFRKYYNEYLELIGQDKLLPIDNIEILHDITYVIEVEGKAEQGTIFYTKDHGWITNYHVIKDHDDDIVVYPSSQEKKYKARVVKEIPQSDIAILEVEGLDINHSLNINKEFEFKLSSKVTVCGYPDHNVHDSLYINSGKIVSERSKNGIDYAVFDKPIIFGNSGGPVVNFYDEIVGIASTGSTFDETDKTMFFGIIPIKNIDLE